MGKAQGKNDAGGNDPQQKGRPRLMRHSSRKGHFLHVNYLPFISNSRLLPIIEY
jgi:hypothetical protein